MMDAANGRAYLSEILYIVNKLDALRERILEQSGQGMEIEPELCRIMAESMRGVADMLDAGINTPEWRRFYENLENARITSDFGSDVLEWERIVLKWIEEEQPQPRMCNICNHEVIYRPKTDYYRTEQQKHHFPYYNMVFESIGRKNCTCPICQSMDRERMIALFLDMLQPEEGERLKVLQIAPSHAIDLWLKEKEYIDYETTDLYMEGVTFQSDIQDMYMVEKETYDVILCSHILEHVEDDRKAMRELNRILKAEGVCIFLVPLVIGLQDTDEEFGLSAEENWMRFGQGDHARLYGREDFLKRLIQAGFLVHVLNQDYFGKEAWEQAGLTDIHSLYVATKKDIGIGVEPYQIKERSEELVSVVIPTYNRGYCIERAVRSVLDSTWKNLEVIVVDDGSTDDTERIVKGIADLRIRYIRIEENHGANHARNVGVKNAKGNYIAFNDSDDEWLSDKLEKQMRVMLQADDEKLGCVYCLVCKYENGKMVSTEPDMEQYGEDVIGDIYHFMLGHMFVSTQTLLLKKKVIEEAGYFNENLARLQDWELLLRVAQKYRFTLVQEGLVRAYLQPDSISKNARGFIDTVFYVIGLHDMAEKNREAYRHWVNVSVNFMKQERQPSSYMEEKFMQIEEEGVFTEKEVRQMKAAVGLAADAAEHEDGLHLKVRELSEKVKEVAESVSENNRILNEILWAQVFNSAKSACKWLPQDTALWPGRWGVGYQYMYVMSRILNDVKPRKILETGLGQSTRLIGSYVKWMCAQSECSHLVIEHDESWIDIFKGDFKLSDSTRIVQRQLSRVLLNDGNHESSTYIYQDMNEVLEGKKFHLISLDGPYGTDERFGYSRIDILPYLPGCLEESFCIVIDDYNRWGEKNTVEYIKAALRKANIRFAEAVYRGTQDMYLMASMDLKFLCTL